MLRYHVGRASLALIVFTGALGVTGLLCGQSLSTQIFPELGQLYKSSADNSPAAKVADLRAREATATAKAMGAGLWPSVDASLGGTVTAEDRKDFDHIIYHGTYTNSLGASYPLFHWGAIWANANKGKETVTQTKLQNTVELNEQKAQVEALYFDLMLKQKRWAIAQDEYQSFDRQLAAQSSAGASTFDIEDQRLQKAQKELELEQLGGEVESLKNRLAIALSGGSETAPATDKPDFSFTFKGFPDKLTIPETWGADALRSSVGQRLYASQAREQHNDMLVNRSEGLPNLDLIGGFFQDQVDSINVSRPVDRNNYYAGLRLRWSLFNGGRSEAVTAASRSRQLRLQIIARQRLAQDRQQLSDDLRTLKTLVGQYDIALARRQIAFGQYSAQVTLKKEGQASQEAFNSAKRTYDSTEIAALDRLTEYLKLYEKIQRTIDAAKDISKNS